MLTLEVFLQGIQELSMGMKRISINYLTPTPPDITRKP